MKKNYRIYSDTEATEKKQLSETRENETREVADRSHTQYGYQMSAGTDPMTSGKIYSMY